MASHVPRGVGNEKRWVEDRLYILQDALSAGMAFEWRAGARRFMRIRTRVSDNGANASVYLYTSSFPFQSLLRQTLFVSGLYRPLFPERRERQIHYHNLPSMNMFGYFEITARHRVAWNYGSNTSWNYWTRFCFKRESYNSLEKRSLKINILASQSLKKNRACKENKNKIFLCWRNGQFVCSKC